MRTPPFLAPLTLIGALAVSLASALATPVSVTVSAAASLADVMKAAEQAYEAAHPDVELVFNYGGSGALQKQIENGAPVDLFLSAAVEPMGALAKAGLVGPAKNVAGNTLVVVRSVNVGLASKVEKIIHSLSDLTDSTIEKIAMGDPASVPAGKYAQEALIKLGLWDKLQSKMVFTKDVRQALTYAQQGNVQVAFVYATDVPHQEPPMVGKLTEIAFTVPDNLHDPIVYPAAVLTKAAHPKEAQAFLDFLSGPEGQALFKKFGFSLPPAP